MKLFFENISEGIKVSMDFPLDAVLEQTMEVFHRLPDDDGSTFGLVTDQSVVLQFQKYNKFMWLIEIPVLSKHGVYQAICNPNQCVRLIEDLYKDLDPFSLLDFKFKSYL